MVVLNTSVGLRKENDQKSAPMIAGYLNGSQTERLRSQSKERKVLDSGTKTKRNLEVGRLSNQTLDPLELMDCREVETELSIRAIDPLETIF